MNDASWKSFHVVGNESNKTETRHGTAELNIVKLTLQLFLWLHRQERFWVFDGLPSTLGLGHPLVLANQIYKLPVAVVYEFNEGLFAGLGCCPVIEEYF
jgi:hypothetical protein